jgi:hypothetical protein
MKAATVKRLWKRKMLDGTEIDATLWHHSGLGEAVVEIVVHSASGDALAESLANGVLERVIAEGAS